MKNIKLIILGIILLSILYIMENLEIYDKLYLSKFENGYKVNGFISEIVTDLNNTYAPTDDNYEYKLLNVKNINSDVKAWINIESLQIDYPVLYSDDNKKYLRTDINGSFSLEGCIFLDSSCGSNSCPIKIVHGHNIKNGKQFSNLESLLKLNSLDDVSNIVYYDEDGLKTYKIFSVFIVDSKEENFSINVYPSLDELSELKDSYLKRSLVGITEVPEGSNIILLNTCWYGKSGVEHYLHCIVAGCLL